jgi:hypothetical protein
MQCDTVTLSRILRPLQINDISRHKHRYWSHTLIHTGAVLVQQGLAVLRVAVHHHCRGPTSGSTPQSHHSTGEATYNSTLQAKQSVQAFQGLRIY